MPRALAMHLFANEHPALSWTHWNEMDGLFVVYILFSLGALLFIRYTPVPRPAPPTAQDQADAKPIGIGWLALFGLGVIFHGHGNLGIFLVILGREASLEVESGGLRSDGRRRHRHRAALVDRLHRQPHQTTGAHAGAHRADDLGCIDPGQHRPALGLHPGRTAVRCAAPWR